MFACVYVFFNGTSSIQEMTYFANRSSLLQSKFVP